MANTTKEQPRSIAEQMAQAVEPKKEAAPPPANPLKSLNDGLYQAHGGQNPQPKQ